MLGGAFDRSMCVGSRAFNLITHLLQCTPRPILPTWRNERYVHVSGKEQQMLFFSDRPGIGSRPASCFPLAFLFLLRPTGDGPRCWILQPFSLVLYLPVLRYLLFLGTFPYLLYPAHRVSDTQFVDLPIRVPDTQFVSYRTSNCSNHESFTGP